MPNQPLNKSSNQLSSRKLSRFKFPAAWAKFLMPFLLSVFMSGLVSLVVTIKLHVAEQPLLSSWVQSWFSSWVIAFPSLLIVLPVVKWIVAAITHPQ